MSRSILEFSSSELELLADEHFRGLKPRCPLCRIGPVKVSETAVMFKAVPDLFMLCPRCGAMGQWSGSPRLEGVTLRWTAVERNGIEKSYWEAGFATCPQDGAILRIHEALVRGGPAELLVHCPRCGRRFDSSDPIPEPIGTRTYASAYREVKPLRSGGMGSVWLVRDNDGNLFAAKRIKEDRLANAEDVKRFRREMKIAQSLDHPAVIPVHEVFIEDQADVIIMEYLEGGNLRDAINDRTTWSPAALVVVFRRITAGLQYLHEKGIIHRDLKPANILLTGKGEPKITDFGLAVAMARTSDPLTKTGQGMGTELYMSPEQRRNAATVDQRTDIYNLGLIAYEIIRRTSPYESPIRRVGGRLGPVLELALESDPERRRVTAEELATALEADAKEGEATTR